MSESESPMTTLLWAEAWGKSLHACVKEPDLWFSALALANVMRTVIDRVQPRAMQCQVSPHVAVNKLQLGIRKEAQCDASLIGDQHHGHAGAVHPGDRLHCPRQPLKLLPAGDVGALRLLAVQHAIAIEKDVTHQAAIYGHC